MDPLVHVVWACRRDDVAARGYWDQTIVEDLFSGKLWRPVRGWRYEHLIGFDDLPPDTGAVVVVPGRMEPDAEWVMGHLERLPWALVMVTSDEERNYRWWDIHEMRHPALRVWVQTPRPLTSDAEADGWLPVGYTPGMIEAAAQHAGPDRDLVWSFAGQITHTRRHEMVEQLETMTSDGEMHLSKIFADGLPLDEYQAMMCRTAVAPCPGGPVCPDTFRVWEALEAGCVPLVDVQAGEREAMDGYWRLLLQEHDPPFPMVEDWADVHDLIAANSGPAWPEAAARSGAWWLQYKRLLAYRLRDQIAELRGGLSAAVDLADAITVVIPTSPVPANPGWGHLAETLGSVAAAGLGGCEVIIMADGVRDEQAHMADAYYQALQAVVAASTALWPRVVPVVHQGHQHQARMLQSALGVIQTPLVLFLEHDCPLDPGIDWRELVGVMATGQANLVRFHHEDHVLAEHKYLMGDEGPELLKGEDIEGRDGVHLWRCMQWSQRPHLATTAYYRRLLADYFDPGERWMIEDRMHSVLQTEPWDDHRVWMYHTEGAHGIRYSRHLDARAGEPKWTDQ